MDENLMHFWNNYENIMKWSCGITRQLQTNNEVFVSNSPRKRAPNYSEYADYFSTNKTSNDDTSDDSDCSEEIDSNYLQFSRITLEHQKKIQEEKRNVDKRYGLCSSSSSEGSIDNISAHKVDFGELYGSNANKIENQESELKSKFINYCNYKKPVLWPGMAFNLSVPEPELRLDLRTPTRPSSE